MRNQRRRRKKERAISFRSYNQEEGLKKKIVREAAIWIVEIILVILAAYLIIAYGVERTMMVGSSMEPTLENGDKLIINKMIYRFTAPKRFDIIVFKNSGREHSYYTIRRIIGLPGETVEIKDGKVYIDGNEIEEKVEVEEISNGGLAKEAITLEEGEYFVLGDNRNESEDSRFGNIGNVTRDSIAGKAWIRLEPFDFVNLISKENQEENQEEKQEPEGKTEGFAG